MSNQSIIESYRRETGRCNGVVVEYAGQIAGWMNELRNPEHWLPGSVAVDETDSFFRATGGNTASGAREWQPEEIT